MTSTVTHSPLLAAEEKTKEPVGFGTFMLTLAYMAQTSQEWMGSELTVKSLVSSKDEMDGIFSSMTRFIKASRIQAKTEVYVAEDTQNVSDKIRQYSEQSDLVFIGMVPPDKNGDPETYVHYYRQLLSDTKGLPLTALCLAGQDVAFQDIFD